MYKKICKWRSAALWINTLEQKLATEKSRRRRPEYYGDKKEIWSLRAAKIQSTSAFPRRISYYYSHPLGWPPLPRPAGVEGVFAQLPMSSSYEARKDILLHCESASSMGARSTESRLLLSLLFSLGSGDAIWPCFRSALQFHYRQHPLDGTETHSKDKHPSANK
jgi:hypothetical protein